MQCTWARVSGLQHDQRDDGPYAAVAKHLAGIGSMQLAQLQRHSLRLDKVRRPAQHHCCGNTSLPFHNEEQQAYTDSFKTALLQSAGQAL